MVERPRELLSWRPAGSPGLSLGCLIEERIDHRALRNGTSVALGRHVLEHPLDLPEILNLPVNLVQVLDGNALDVGAGVPPPIDEPQQRADLVERETELSAPPDETQALDMIFAVQPVPPFGPGGAGHQPNALVVADRLDVAAGALRQGSDRQPDGRRECRRPHEKKSLNL